MHRQKIAESCVEKHPENYEFTVDRLKHDE